MEKTFEQIQQEYAQLAGLAGDLAYKIKAESRHLDTLHEKMRLLQVENTALTAQKALEAQQAEKPAE
jgi:hypothetical protein